MKRNATCNIGSYQEPRWVISSIAACFSRLVEIESFGAQNNGNENTWNDTSDAMCENGSGLSETDDLNSNI